ncbi:MAG: hypothetical protein R3253_05310 [Longimicrobiales bacterium]|nr:hypothetical protein [Longimicrobiales bacterium]
MLTPGPIEVVVALFLSLRRFGVAKTVLAAIVVAAGIRLLLPPVPCSCFRPLVRRCDNSIRYRAVLRSDLKNLASQQEIYFSEALRYGEDFQAMAFTQSNGVEVDVEAGPEGWTAWATHAATGPERGCTIFYGRDGYASAPGAPGWAQELMGQPGEVACNF